MERTLEQLRQHYEVEKELANRLRDSTKEQRRRLYGECYDELFRRVPDHPQLTRRADPDAQRDATEARAHLVRQFLKPGHTFMEIGPGDCSLSLDMCSVASQVYAIDVSAEITNRIVPPANFKLILSDGSNIQLPDSSVDVAFSYQLIEHLHTVDTEEHLAHVHRVLKPGGVYICVTPNRLNGPHDISRYFDSVATGFHMREYSNGDLVRLFTRAGFTITRPMVGLRGRFVPLPAAPITSMERLIGSLPAGLRKRLATAPVVYRLLGVTFLATK
jgi:SAM-dependent methyltransferase